MIDSLLSMLKQHLKQYNERAADAVLFCYPCFDAKGSTVR